MFKKVEPQLNLPKVEEEILKFWDENKTFEKSLEIRKDAPEYIFYDGPPFATGTPHYGHIVSGLMKDVMPRYFTMKGRLVKRKWGWDCHGLPIENIAEKELGIKTKKQIEEMGVPKFNEFCRSKVLSYVDEWKKVIRRLGRWVDMENAYKTMDLNYMESVWWVFKQLYDRGLVYEGYRSMHICPRCETTLSQFEVAEGYKDVKDLSVYIKFKIDDPVVFPNTCFLVWTTTPWTLIGNVALAINPGIEYAKVKLIDSNKEEFFILAKDRVEDVFSDKNFEIVEEISAQKLISVSYLPLFDSNKNNNSLKNYNNGWKIVPANFVTTDEGTGIVHIAPAFGEDDMNLGKEMNLPFIQHVGMDGIIKSGNGKFSGLSVKPADDIKSTDKKIIEFLEKNNKLFLVEEFEHSYPYCWRCDTPLINYATSSWFVAVEKIKKNALEYAKEINWSPKHIKDGRFGNWLENARDWSISRQRYWASAVPIWRCQKCGQIKVVDSVKEIEELSGCKVTDLHKHIVDEIEFDCDKCDGKMKRIPDVLDTWFDSGSMPYAQLHYPFENKTNFEHNFPADFIAEGVDQTRAWFYYLHLLSSAIMKKPAYKNVIVNGIVLAEDGKKMAKRLKNYPDPMEIFEKYGADTLRLYLLSSPVMSAENLSLKESDLVELQKGLFRMLWSSYYFFILYANIDHFIPKNQDLTPTNILDKWIISKIEKLNIDLEKSMNSYDLVISARTFQPFVDDLSNWYIRRSRKRFWKSENDNDKNSAYETLYYVLVKLSLLMAPFTPFISEEIYKNLTGKDSVHLQDFPEAKKELINEKLIISMDKARKYVEIGLAKRAEAKIRVRQPLSEVKYKGEKLSPELESIIADELNVKKIIQASVIKDEIELNTSISPELEIEGCARELVRTVQSLRKKADFNISDRIELFYDTDSDTLLKAFSNHEVYIKNETLSDAITNSRADVEHSQEEKIAGENIWFGARRKKT